MARDSISLEDDITNGGYVLVNPTEKWNRPINLACMIDKATGL